MDFTDEVVRLIRDYRPFCNAWDRAGQRNREDFRLMLDRLFPFTKICSRCRSAFTPMGWSKLEHVGDQDDGVEVIELRNCPCGTTLAVVKKEHSDA